MLKSTARLSGALLLAAALIAPPFSRAAEHPSGGEHPTSRPRPRQPAKRDNEFKEQTTEEEVPAARERPKGREHPTKREHPIAPTPPSRRKEFRAFQAPRPHKRKKRTRRRKKRHEHPGGEHPSHDPSAAKRSVSIEDVAVAVERYIDRDSELKGGYFFVYDEEKSMALPLTLKKIHRNRLAALEEDLYFVCADFTTPRGRIYDLDLMVRGSNKYVLDVTKIFVRKEAGKPRYTWAEKNGVWYKVPI